MASSGAPGCWWPNTLLVPKQVKILRALPNSEKTQAHWEGGPSAMQMRSELLVGKLNEQSKGLTRRSPLETLLLWIWKEMPAVPPLGKDLLILI